MGSEEVEALAEAWASMDGKLEQFHDGRKATEVGAYGGYYEGYLADADELFRRLNKHGFSIVRIAAPSPGGDNG